MYSLGLPVPQGLDGRVVREIFTAAYQAEHPINLGAETETAIEPRQQVYSAGDEALIAEKLKSLGYLD